VVTDYAGQDCSFTPPWTDRNQASPA